MNLWIVLGDNLKETEGAYKSSPCALRTALF